LDQKTLNCPKCEATTYRVDGKTHECEVCGFRFTKERHTVCRLLNLISEAFDTNWGSIYESPVERSHHLRYPLDGMNTLVIKVVHETGAALCLVETRDGKGLIKSSNMREAFALKDDLTDIGIWLSRVWMNYWMESKQ